MVRAAPELATLGDGALRPQLCIELRGVAQGRGMRKSKWTETCPFLLGILKEALTDRNLSAEESVLEALTRLSEVGHLHSPVPNSAKNPPTGIEWASVLKMLLNVDHVDAAMLKRQASFSMPDGISTYFGCTSVTSSRFRESVVAAAIDVFVDFLLTIRSSRAESSSSAEPDGVPSSTPIVYMACKQPPSDRARLCKTVGELLGLAVDIGDSHPGLPEMKTKIQRASVIVALWEDLPTAADQAQLSDDLRDQIAIAVALDKDIHLINAALSAPLPRFSVAQQHPPIDLREVEPEANAVKLMKLFGSLQVKGRGASAAAQEPEHLSYRRLAVHTLIRFSSDHKCQTATEVELLSLRDGLADVQHSLHMNYKLYNIVASAEIAFPVEVIGIDPVRSFRILQFDRRPDKYSFQIGIDPPLRKQERTRFGWQSPWLDYLPLTRDQITVLADDEDFEFQVGEVEHHWCVNHPTDQLTITLEFASGQDVTAFGAVSFVGRRFRIDSIDREETERISDCLVTHSFLNRKTVRLEVAAPLTGNLYAIRYRLPAC